MTSEESPHKVTLEEFVFSDCYADPYDKKNKQIAYQLFLEMRLFLQTKRNFFNQKDQPFIYLYLNRVGHVLGMRTHIMLCNCLRDVNELNYDIRFTLDNIWYRHQEITEDFGDKTFLSVLVWTESMQEGSSEEFVDGFSPLPELLEKLNYIPSKFNTEKDKELEIYNKYLSWVDQRRLKAAEKYRMYSSEFDPFNEF